MISLAITALIIAIAIVSVMQPSAGRLFAALVFSIVMNAHDVFLSGLDGFAYYFSAALSSLLVIILTSGISPTPKMVVTLQKVCLTSIVVNAIGWVLWFFYISPVYYNLTFILIFGWAFFTLIRKDTGDVGDFTVSSWRSCFRFNHHPIYLYLFKNEGKT